MNKLISSAIGGVIGEHTKFCDRCNSRMTLSKKGYVCSKCGHTMEVTAGLIEVKNIKIPESEPITTIDELRQNIPKIDRQCPHCRNQKAFHWFSTVNGEHAGVKQERTVEHFICTEYQHTWTITR
jgi:DNA-directed RNA polymerase subunit M/transcription elongation factor TFIIS